MTSTKRGLSPDAHVVHQVSASARVPHRNSVDTNTRAFSANQGVSRMSRLFRRTHMPMSRISRGRLRHLLVWYPYRHTVAWRYHGPMVWSLPPHRTNPLAQQIRAAHDTLPGRLFRSRSGMDQAPDGDGRTRITASPGQDWRSTPGDAAQTSVVRVVPCALPAVKGSSKNATRSRTVGLLSGRYGSVWGAWGGGQ